MARIQYTETEQLLLDYFSYMNEIPIHELEELAEDMERGESRYVAIELSRCPSTDQRTYILHTWSEKPRFDYYGAEEVNLKILRKGN